MDTDIWLTVRILYDSFDGTLHVPGVRKIAQTDEQVLWNEMGGLIGIHWTVVLHPCFLYVDRKSNTRKENVAEIFRI